MSTLVNVLRNSGSYQVQQEYTEIMYVSRDTGDRELQPACCRCKPNAELIEPYLANKAHVAMKDGHESPCVREEGDEVVGKLGDRRVHCDHGLPLLDKVVPVILVQRV